MNKLGLDHCIWNQSLMQILTNYNCPYQCSLQWAIKFHNPPYIDHGSSLTQPIYMRDVFRNPGIERTWVQSRFCMSASAYCCMAQTYIVLGWEINRAYGGAGLEALVVDAAGVLFLVTREFKTIANPLIWVLCSSETLISRLSIVPFAVEPLRTAGGCGWPSGGRAVAGTGIIPSEWRAGNDATGSWTGMAAPDWYGE